MNGALLGLSSAGPVGWAEAGLALLLAFVLSQIIAGIYIYTFKGLSFARGHVQGMALGALVTCMLMLALGDSVAAGIGIAGGLSIIRFRTTLRDPRDVIFLFAALGVGLVCGLRAPVVAISGTVAFCVASLGLHLIGYGARNQLDGMVRFFAPASPEVSAAVGEVLRKHTHHFVLVTMREVEQGRRLEQAYQVHLRSGEGRAALVLALQAVDGLTDLSLHVQDPTLEL
ncbi:MAG: hypothetical protein RL071_1846 [Pseudomonadota bacterium]|jgi:hypothetical protein